MTKRYPRARIEAHRVHLDDPCPNGDNHTPHPSGYLEHGDWAEKMAETHHQVKCPGCGLYAIWLPSLVLIHCESGRKALLEGRVITYWTRWSNIWVTVDSPLLDTALIERGKALMSK